MFDENSMVDRVLSGDEAAFERLVDRYENKVYQYALRFLGQETEASAVTEEVFSQIYRGLSENADEQLHIWMFRTAANICAEKQRRKRGVKSPMAVIRLHEPPRDEEERARSLTEGIQEQLLRLTRQQREVILLRDLCGMDDDETAKILDINKSGIRLRLSRARKNLRDLLVGENILQEPKERSGSTKENQHYRELCSQYVDEYISAEDKAALLDHIQECPSCAAYLNDLTDIGRSLSHMAEDAPPEELRGKIIEAARQQAKHMQNSRKREYYVPVGMVVGAAAIILALIGSGVLGGLFVNSSQVRTPGIYGHGSGGQQVVLTEDINVPDVVTANSYAFVIAAAGEVDLPELSTSAELLAGNAGDGVEYYSVDNDFNLVQKLTDGLESVGYEMETVTNDQIVISSGASEGLFIIIRGDK